MVLPCQAVIPFPDVASGEEITNTYLHGDFPNLASLGNERLTQFHMLYKLSNYLRWRNRVRLLVPVVELVAADPIERHRKNDIDY